MKTYIAINLLAIVLICCTKTIQAQNVVRNYSFEDKSRCPQRANDGILPLNWDFRLNGKSPDYINSCSPSTNCGSRCVNTTNNWKGSQSPRTGNGYAGIIAYYGYGDGSAASEYIYQELSSPLQRGVKYYIEFWVSLAEQSLYSVRSLGMYLTHDPQELVNVSFSYKGLYNLNPQISNSSSAYYKIKAGWAKISGFYTPSRSDIRHIVISNFDKGVLTNSPDIQTNVGGNTSRPESYYYIDDVRITPASLVCELLIPQLNTKRVDLVPGGASTIRSASPMNWSVSPELRVLSKNSTVIVIEGNKTGTYFVTGTRIDCNTKEVVTVKVSHSSSPPPPGGNPPPGPGPVVPQPQVVVYPNPVSEILSIKLIDYESSSTLKNGDNTLSPSFSLGDSHIKAFSAKLFNRYQQLVREVESSQVETELNMRGLPPGTYFLHTTYKGKVSIQQIVIE